MNREIKFRVWCKDYKRWENQLMLSHNGYLYDYDLGRGRLYNSSKTHIIQQFTGLKDKNDKEIYEGDIVTALIPHGNNIHRAKTYDVFISVVNFTHGGFTIDVGEEFESFLGETSVEIKIIGNIFENPELLKK